mgnify:CR=1 FL=1|tara:strand:+ start:842 stop:1015 length:174 start_codon:yes stop_codon:yes gene_type:complete
MKFYTKLIQVLKDNDALKAGTMRHLKPCPKCDGLLTLSRISWNHKTDPDCKYEEKRA